MKPKRFYFRSTPLFSAPLRYGAPVFIGFTVLLTGLTSEAAIYGSGSSSKSAPAPGGASAAGGNAPAAAAANAARANAKEVLNRTNRAVGAALAMQKAAQKAAAKNGANHLGKNPNRPTENLPDVPNGLGVGGLQVAPGVGTDPSKWVGAELPVSVIKNVEIDGKAGGKPKYVTQTKVTIKQTSQQALLNWQTFNVGKNTKVTFDQSKGGTSASKWVAFNKINDPSGNPTQILGSIKAQGQVYLINGNGIIFGGNSQVNARALTASSLPINDNLIKSGLLNNPDSQFLFSGLSIPAGKTAPAFVPEAALAINGGKYGDVIVQKGAVLKSPTNAEKVGGRIMLVGPNVVNEGSISTIDGQTILAAGLQVGLTAHAAKNTVNKILPEAAENASLRGLDVFIGKVAAPVVGSYSGNASNLGVIDVPRGNITIAGREVNQSGVLTSSTTVAFNGRIDLSAQYDTVIGTGSGGVTNFLVGATGTVNLGKGSIIRILPELKSKATTIGTELTLRSQVNITGKVAYFGQDSILLAPNALVNVLVGERIVSTNGTSILSQSKGQVYFDESALVDVSGSGGVVVPVSQNIVTVQLRGAELANSPLQRDGVLRGAEVSVDIRDQGIYQQEMWRGTALADLSGFINLIQKSVGQLTVAGGSVNISAGESVVMGKNSKINVSGGSIQYQGGVINTTKLITKGGRLIDIRDARPDEKYQGIFDEANVETRDKWSFRNVSVNPLSPTGGKFEGKSISGGAGGSLAISAPGMVLDGKFQGDTISGERQRLVPAANSSLTLNFSSRDTRSTADLSNPISPTPPKLVFQSDVSPQTTPVFSLDAQGNPTALPEERLDNVFLSSELLTKQGFGVLSIDNHDGEIIVPSSVNLNVKAGGRLDFQASNITIDGKITAPNAQLSFKTYNFTYDQSNAFLLSGKGNLAPPLLIADRGIFRLGKDGVISTAGLLVDDRLSSRFAGSLPLQTRGGSIAIQGLSADLSAGGVIDVSGGAVVNERGAVTYGAGGTLTLTTGNDVQEKSISGGILNLGATLRGYSGTVGGSLKLGAGAFQVGGVLTDPTKTLINPQFFSQGGFNSITLEGLGLISATPGSFVAGVTIVSGTEIRPIAQNYVLSPSSASKLAFKTMTREEGVRLPVNLTFSAKGLDAEFAGQTVVRGDVMMEAGSSILTDAKGSVTLAGNATTVLGSITSPGGSIRISGGNDRKFILAGAPNTIASVLIGGTARLSAVGKTVLTESPFGIRQGEVLKGGTISVTGNIVAEQGAVLDVSGTQGILDLDPRAVSLKNPKKPDLGGGKFVPVKVASNGGSIEMTGLGFLYSDATLIGKAGGKSAIGGSVTIQSGKFIPDNAVINTPPLNLMVSQGKLILPDSSVPRAVGNTVLGTDGKALPGMGIFNLDGLTKGSFDSLALNGNVEFDGPVSLKVPGSLRVGTGSLISAKQTVDLTASYIALGQAFQLPQLLGTEEGILTPSLSSASFGSGRLQLTAKLIDIGNLSLQEIGSARFDATQGDIRGNGTLSAVGDLFFKAGQIYPTTAGVFNIFAHNHQNGSTTVPGSVTIEGGTPRSLPFSAGGKLSIYASEIRHGGTLRAPIGTINLGWDGTGKAPGDLISGIIAPVTSQLTLTRTSVTSVSAIDPLTKKPAILPYGISLDGTAWIDPAGNEITINGLPAKTINLSAANLSSENGSVIDLKGGGDLYGYRWISGNGGKVDVLASQGSFAVIPGYGFDYAPYAPFNTGTAAAKLGGAPGYVNSSLKVGDQITLGKSKNLPAGTYTLLPARYALLPGAFLVTPQSGIPTGTVKRPDGATVVSGFRANNLDPSRTGITQIARFEVANSKVVRARAQYQDLLANTILRDAAIARDLAIPRLPVDAGYLSFSSTSQMSLAGKVQSSTPITTNDKGVKFELGRRSLIDINSPGNILINNTGEGGGVGDLVIQSSLLNSFGAESLLVGGLRSFTENGVTVSVNADRLTLDNAGSKLSGSDIILVAEGELTLAKNSQIVATASQKEFDAITIGNSNVAGSGNGSLVRVSGIQTGAVVRRGVGTSTLPNLLVQAGAELSGGNIVLDSTSGTNLSPEARLLGSAISLSSGQLSIQLTNPGPLNPTTGLVLSGSALGSLQSSATNLKLVSYSSIDLYGTGNVGSNQLEKLSLEAAAIRGFNTGSGTATFLAKNLSLGNSSLVAAPPALGGTPQGQIVFDAEQITLGVGNVMIDGFAKSTLQAEGGILVTNRGRLNATSDLILKTPLLTGATIADYEISSSGSLEITRTSSTSSRLVAGGLGAELDLIGARVRVNSDITLASGELTLKALSGDVIVGDSSSAKLDLSGTSKQLVDVTRYTSGGIVNLASSGGSVRINGQAEISVAAKDKGGNAGQIHVVSPDGEFVLAGTINGFAGTTGRKGEFSLDTRSIAGGSLANLDTLLNAGNFTQSREYRVRTGNVTIDGLANSHTYRVFADAGDITVANTINASGTTGGTIDLKANGNLTLLNGSVLNASGSQFSSAGKGGSVTLEAGTQRNGLLNPAAILDLRAGSSIKLGITANHTTSATLGKFTGTLHLRAPRTAGNDGIQIASIGSDINSASSILVEGYKIYTPTGGNITAAVQNEIKSDAEAFLGVAGTESASYTTMLSSLGRPDLDLILAPGVEIINPSGNLTLGSLTSVSTSDWDLGTFRFGPRSAAGVLALRATGNLQFYNALSDGFQAVTANAANGNSSLWLAPLLAQNPLLPVNSQSWSYRFTAGADLSAADFGAVRQATDLPAGVGSLLLGKNYGNASFVSGRDATTASAISNRFQVIRTGSGNIDIHAARNVHLLNQFSTIYTAGTQVADPTSLFTTGDFAIPNLLVTRTNNPTGIAATNLGILQQIYPAQYSLAGGNLSIRAGGDISRLTRNANNTQTGGILIPDSSRQLPINWLYRRGFIDPATGEFGISGINNVTPADPAASTTWWVNFSNFFEGVGTLGGGDVTLTAGNDVQNIDAVAATNARAARGRPDPAKLIELGGGDVTVLAGRNIDGGVYYIERGQGRLEAGNAITTNQTRSPSQGILSSLTNPSIADENTWLPTTLFLGKGGFNVEARGDVLIGPAVNPFLLPSGISNQFWYKTYFNTYDPSSFLNVTSLGGSITHRSTVVNPPTSQFLAGSVLPVLEAWMINQNLYFGSITNGATIQPWLRLSESKLNGFFDTILSLTAPNLKSTALSGDINLAGGFSLFPSSKGQIELVAAGSISALRPLGKSSVIGTTAIAQTFSSATINLSDADPSSIPGILTPLAYQSAVGRSLARLQLTEPVALAGITLGANFLKFIDDKFKETGATNQALEQKISLHGTTSLHQGDTEPVRIFALNGDIQGLTLFSPKATRVIAGNDISDIALYIQNVNPNDYSIVSAGRDLKPFDANTPSRLFANSPGNQVLAGELPLAGDIQISGPGTLQVLAGRDIDLGTGLDQIITNGTNVGITSVGNLRNLSLSSEGADIVVGAGIGPATSFSGSNLLLDDFIEDFVLTETGQKYLKKIAPKVDFSKLTKEEQASLALEIFYLTLRDAGRDFNKPKSPNFRKYTNGLAAIKALFGKGPWDGEIKTQLRNIRTGSGGDISIFAPGGGLALASNSDADKAPPGIVTESGGNISIYTDQNVDIGDLRIFTLRGGNIVIWSDKGDIAAGSSSKSIASAPPTRVVFDVQSAAVETDLAGLATGGGIGVLATVKGVKPGDVDLIAPTGIIDAGDAGIRVTGNINLAAVTVTGGDNISAGGSSTGAPTAASAPSISTVTTASNTSAATSSAVTNQAATGPKPEEIQTTDDNTLSLITVEVIGYGGNEEEDDEEKKKQSETP